MQVHWRIRLPVALSVDTSFTFPSRQKSARSTDRHLLARFQSPFLIASATAGMHGRNAGSLGLTWLRGTSRTLLTTCLSG